MYPLSPIHSTDQQSLSIFTTNVICKPIHLLQPWGGPQCPIPLGWSTGQTHPPSPVLGWSPLLSPFLLHRFLLWLPTALHRSLLPLCLLFIISPCHLETQQPPLTSDPPVSFLPPTPFLPVNHFYFGAFVSLRTSTHNFPSTWNHLLMLQLGSQSILLYIAILNIHAM